MSCGVKRGQIWGVTLIGVRCGEVQQVISRPLADTQVEVNVFELTYKFFHAIGHVGTPGSELAATDLIRVEVVILQHSLYTRTELLYCGGKACEAGSVTMADVYIIGVNPESLELSYKTPAIQTTGHAVEKIAWHLQARNTVDTHPVNRERRVLLKKTTGYKHQHPVVGATFYSLDLI